jgi:hypothetical protein
MARTKGTRTSTADTPKKAGRNPAKLLWNQITFAYKKKNKPMPYKYFNDQMNKIDKFTSEGWDTTTVIDELQKYYDTHKIPIDQDKTHPRNNKSSAPASRPARKQYTSIRWKTSQESVRSTTPKKKKSSNLTSPHRKRSVNC